MIRFAVCVAVCAIAAVASATGENINQAPSPTSTPSYVPVVLLHGLFASAEAMSHAEAWITDAFPGIHVLNVEIGDGKLDSLVISMNKQAEMLAEAVRADPKLARGFNLVAHSQGGLTARAYVERFNDPPVKRLVTWASPHGGQFGIPDIGVFPALDTIFSELVDGKDATLLQSVISFAAYWKDPFNLTAYRDDSIYLADLNNEGRHKNTTYRANMLKLEQLGLVYSAVDRIVVPKESPTFAFFANGTTSTVVPMRDTDQYKEDWLGLRTLDTSGRLHTFASNCSHQDLPRDVCKDNIWPFTAPFLNVTW